MKQNLLTTAILSICLSIGLTAQTTGLTDDFSNETNSLAIYTEGIGTFTTSELEIIKTIANGELTIDYDWITNNGFNSIKITPPNGTTFDLSATGQGLSFEYSSTDAYKITIGYQGQTPGSYTGYLEVTNTGETKTFTVPASAIPSYSAIPFLQIIVNTGGGQALDNSDADGSIVIDNLVIGDGSFQVKDTLGISNNEEVLEAAIYPNPTMGIVNVTSKETIKAYTVYSITGQLLLSKDLNTQGKDIQINLEELSNGIYMLELSGEKSKSIQKVILN